jgi:hypothetical protein
MAERARRHASACLREERGVASLAELISVIPIMLIVLGSVLGLYSLAVRQQDRTDARVRSLIDQKNGLERISRELRDAVALRYQTSEIVDAQISSGGRWLRYDCSGTACKRYEGPSEGVFDRGPVTLVDDVRSAEFELLANSATGFQPDYVNPTYVSVRLRVNVRGAENPIVLEDGFNLRNLTRPS